jgi:hypothetical protein
MAADLPDRLLKVSNWIYGGLVRAYPPGFQKRFAPEMIQVNRSLCRQVYLEEGSFGLLRLWLLTLWDWASSALVQWRQTLSRGRIDLMNTALIDKSDGTTPLPLGQVALAALPFLLFGFASLASRLDFLQTKPASLPLWQVLLIQPYLIFNWLILAGLAVGMMQGFPRWAFSYLGWAILMGWWWSDMRFYGYELGWKIWLPLLAVMAIPLILRRSLLPLGVIWTSLRRDLTLFSLGVYILYSHMGILADENHHPYLAFFIMASALAACLGAWGFFSSTSPLRRVLSLIGGWFLATLLGLVNSATWDYRAYYGLPEREGDYGISIIGVLFYAGLIASFLLLSWVTGRLRQKRKI